MSSLKGAPSLQRPPQRGFSYDVFDDYNDDDDDDDDDDYIPPPSSDKELKKKSKKKEKKMKEKKEKEKKEKGQRQRQGNSNRSEGHVSDSSGGGGGGGGGSATVGTSGRSGGGDTRSKPVSAVEEEDYIEEEYSDKFDLEVDDGDDDKKEVPTTLPITPSVDTLGVRQHGVSEGAEAHFKRIAEETARAMKEQHEEQLRRWQMEQERMEMSLQRHQCELRAQMEELKQIQERRSREAESAAKNDGNECDANVAVDTGMGASQQPRSEVQRRRVRERERAVHLRRLEQEEAARSLFQRLAQDVREVFHELNLSVVAAEKERLIKDERYRKEREMRDRHEEMERQERLQKEMKEREEREAKFWNAMEVREDRFRALVESKAAKDEEEREARRKRDLEEREIRLKADKELRNELDRIDRDRRDREDASVRERDRVLIQTQLDDMKRQYESQVDEVRRQFELDRAHVEEMHRMELTSIEKRHAESVGQSDRVHVQQVAMMEAHVKNAAELEKLIAQMHKDVEATKNMNVVLTEERLAVVRQKEQLVSEQKALVDAVLEELKYTKQEMEKERTRVVSLYAKFDISLSNFTKEAAEERRRCQEAQAHYETLRQQLEKDKKLMLHEVAHERKVFEQQYEEFMTKKLQAMSELQEERMAIARERTEAAMVRERQNRDETELLKSLRAQEEAYAAKVEGIEEDRVAISEMRLEQKRMCEEIAAEREALRRERQAFESEKNDLLMRFEEVQRRAAEAGAANQRLHHEMELQSAAKAKASMDPAPRRIAMHLDPVEMSGAASRLQIDLSRQRAILNRLSHT